MMGPLAAGLSIVVTSGLPTRGNATKGLPIMDSLPGSHGYQTNTPDGLDAALLNEIFSGMVMGGAAKQLVVSCHETPSMTAWGEVSFTSLPLAILELQLNKF